MCECRSEVKDVLSEAGSDLKWCVCVCWGGATWPCHIVSAESDDSHGYDGELSCAALLTFSSSLILLFPKAKLCQPLLRASEPETPQGYTALP